MKRVWFGVLFLWAIALSHAAVRREPWTASRIEGSPEKPPNYKLERAFSGIALTNPVDLAFSAELRLWFVGEQAGRVLTFDSDGRQLNVAADFGVLQGREGTFYALTFDPWFASNRYVYICYALKADLPEGTHVSRFKVTGTTLPKIDLASEEVLISWLSGGHNGCCLKFGNDGMLYISTGDAAGPNPPDPFKTGQDISDLLSSILRIDLRSRDPGKNYSVPKDNPFFGRSNARPEVWAYGLRNPWRMAFDAQTGELWVGDVGWELWELVHRIEKGGNYGWSIFEGRQPVLPNDPRGPTPITPPLKDHPHSEAASITGGLVYYGTEFPELRGAFIYGDWETGKIWGLKSDKERVTWSQELTDSTARIVAFAPDDRGEIVVLDYSGGIYRLRANPAASRPVSFPHKLSETGLFSDTRALVPARGVYPFEVIAPMWRDYAQAERLIALRGDSRVDTSERPWKFASNAVLAMTFSLEMEHGKPATRKRIETQVLHFTGDGWGAYSYRWNDLQTDAELVPAEGTNASFEIKDANQPGGVRRQNWRFHARAECLRCHNPWCGTALGFQAEQLGSRVADLAAFLSANPKEKVAPLTDPYDPSHDLNARARSYLHANCSHCHRDNAGGAVRSVMNYDLPLDKLRMAGVRPTFGDFGLVDGKVIAPGQPFSSVLLFRTTTTGRGRMPYISSELVDERGIALLRDWVATLGNSAQTGSDEPAAVRNTTDALRIAHRLLDKSQSERESTARELAKSPDPLVRELFDRFLPAPEQIRRSHEALSREQILALRGDAKRGDALLADANRLSCLQCHQIHGNGRSFGPDLSVALRGKSREQILESILSPSKEIAPDFVLYTLEDDSEPVSGIVTTKTETDFTLRDSAGLDHRFPSARLKALRAQQLSAMPEGLLSNLTAQEAADLIEALRAQTN